MKILSILACVFLLESGSFGANAQDNPRESNYRYSGTLNKTARLHVWLTRTWQCENTSPDMKKLGCFDPLGGEYINEADGKRIKLSGSVDEKQAMHLSDDLFLKQPVANVFLGKLSPSGDITKAHLEQQAVKDYIVSIAKGPISVSLRRIEKPDVLLLPDVERLSFSCKELGLLDGDFPSGQCQGSFIPDLLVSSQSGDRAYIAIDAREGSSNGNFYIYEILLKSPTKKIRLIGHTAGAGLLEPSLSPGGKYLSYSAVQHSSAAGGTSSCEVWNLETLKSMALVPTPVGKKESQNNYWLRVTSQRWVDDNHLEVAFSFAKAPDTPNNVRLPSKQKKVFYLKSLD